MKKLLLSSLLIVLMITVLACQIASDDPTEYTVTFDTSGGTAIADQVIEEGNLVVKPADPTREGYIFTDVWLDGTDAWDFTTDLVTEDLTLSAVWVGVDEVIPTESVMVSADEFDLPEANNAEDRPEVALGTTITLSVDFLPFYASNQDYTITTSNSRAEVDGNTVTFAYGITGLGNVSVFINFDDAELGRLEYRFLTVPAPTSGIIITNVTVTAGDFTMPAVNNADARPRVVIGTEITLSVDILPENAANKNYTVSSSNSRAIVDDHTITFVYGDTGPGNVSIRVFFEDSSVGNAGMLEYRFETFEDAVVDVEIDSVLVTADGVDLPTVNDIDARPEIEIGTVITLDISILPENASNQNYTITTSNSRATVDGHTVTFLYGITGPGNVSVRILFEDTSVGIDGLLEYRFLTVEGEAPEVLIDEVIISAGDFTLPTINNLDDRPTVEIGTVITLDVSILPVDASNQNYTITTSNSRATVDGHTVTFLYGNTGPGSVSIRIYFEDTSVGINGLIEFRFSTVETSPEE